MPKISRTKKLVLPSGDVAYVDLLDWIRYDLESYSWWLCKPDGDSGRKYVATKRNRTTLLLHRLLTGAADGMYVDHHNANGLDNRRRNLRVCTQSQNLANRRKSTSHAGRATSSRFKGVTFNKLKGKWVAQIKVDRKLIYLGSFDDEVDAARAYDTRALEAWGEFARINL